MSPEPPSASVYDARMRFQLILGLTLVLLLALVTPLAGDGEQASRLPGGPQGLKAEPARFSDPARREKLRSAFPDIDRLVREFATREHIPGAAWGLVVDGELVHLGTAGSIDADRSAPVTGDTVFRIASMTKSFTAMAILSLRDAGKLSLDDPAERYVPELSALPYPTGDSPRITIRHLLSHAAGFPEDNPWGDQQLSRTEDEFTSMLHAGIPFSNPPGVAYQYSNFGFALLGRIVSRASGMPYRTTSPRAFSARWACRLRPWRPPRSRRPGWPEATVGRTGAGRKSRRFPTARSGRWAAC